MIKVFKPSISSLPYKVTDIEKAIQLGYNVDGVVNKHMSVYSPVNDNQGFGEISGKTMREDLPAEGALVRLYNQNSGVQIWSRKTNTDGTYRFVNVSPSITLFLISFDANNEYNAITHSHLKAKIPEYKYTRG